MDLEHVGSFEIVERLVETGSSDSVDNAAPCRTAARRSAAARSCPCSPGSQAVRDDPAVDNDGQAGKSAQLHMRSVPRSLEPGALAGFHRHLGSQEAGNTDSAEMAVLDSAFCGPSLVARNRVILGPEVLATTRRNATRFMQLRFTYEDIDDNLQFRASESVYMKRH